MSVSADRNLLYGILAVQLDFVTRDQLVAGMNAWLLDKAKPLGDLLRDQGHLSPERLQLLAALVAEHLKLHGGDPQRSLAALSSVPPTLKQQLAALPDEAVQQSIAHMGAVRLSEPVAEPDQTVAQPPPPPSAVRYRILRPHAKGGLGEVFVADDTELGRPVALKEIQNRYADDVVSRERFVREAEVTGGLEHPGIVPVYGLGTYDDGRPFYAMRFVRGDNLQQAIQRFHGLASGQSGPPPGPGDRALAFRGLIRRFVDVCNAVAYAHGRGVLHRDLKPGNVMLGNYGETLVVDWGLAKALGQTVEPAVTEPPLRPRTAGDSAGTEDGQVVGTPAYMSPEQASGRLDLLGPATDIYGLGATLYELLTGRPPFTSRDFDSVQTGGFPPPRRVAPAVPRPLEAVCLKAMALSPSARYGSPKGLAAEMERWLADEPVTAYREPAGARLGRWVRKHARLATGVGAALAVGMAALGGLAWQREGARQVVAAKEAEAVRERDRAVAARTRTRGALDAMVSEVTGESLAAQKKVSPEQTAFLRTVLKYYEEFAAEPGEDREGRERLARAHHRLGLIHDRLGDRAEGAAVFGRAADLYARLAADFPDVPDYRRHSAHSQNNLGFALAELGRRAEAEAAYRAAAGRYETLIADFPAVPDYRSDLAGSQNNLGAVLLDLGRLADAEVACRAATDMFEKLAADFPVVPNRRQELATSRINLGLLFARAGRLSDAETAYGAAAEVLEKLVADFPAVPVYRRDLAVNRMNLGSLLVEAGRRADAEASFRAAVDVFEKLAAEFPAVPDYRHALALSRDNLGRLLAELGRRTDAVAAVRAAVGMLEKLAAEFPAVPAYRHNLAVARLRLGDLLARSGEATQAVMATDGVLAIASDARTLYDCACVVALAAGAPENRDADGHGGRAVKLLRQAFAKGYHNIPHFLADADLDPLRHRDDFAALLWDLADAQARLPIPRPQR